MMMMCFRCLACVSSVWRCNWCPLDQLCTHNHSCPNQHIILNQRVRQPVCLPVCLFVCLSVCLPVCLSVSLSVCLSACLPVLLSVCLPVCLFVCLPVCLFVCLSACLFVCLSAYLAIFSSCLSLSLSAGVSWSHFLSTGLCPAEFCLGAVGPEHHCGAAGTKPGRLHCENNCCLL